MSDEPTKDAQKKVDEPVSTEKVSKNKEAEAPPRRVSEEDLAKEIKNQDVARSVAELLRGQAIASVYIDMRSGGNFFSGEANITGDVVSGERIHKTQFTGPASGPIHTGSGDIHYYGKAQSKGRSVNLGRVLEGACSKIRAVYIGSPQYDQARKVLAEKHVVILWGQARWGKWTSAIHLLLNLNAEEIIEIRPDLGLDDLHDVEFESKNRCGYVIDTLVPDSAEKLKAHTLKALSLKLRKQQSYLVITIDSRVNLFKDDLSGYLSTWNEVLNLTLMLEKHVAYYLASQDELAKAPGLIKNETVQQLLRDPLLPGEIDRLAELLSKVARNELNFDEALARFEACAQQRVEAWFAEHADLEQRTFMLALAVFNGASYDAVIAADQRLQSLLGPILTNKETAASVFSNTRSRRVKEACAHIEKGYVETEFGPSPVDLVVLDNPSFQPAVLRYTWQEYDRLREPLLAWLHELGLQLNFDVRARAAAAVGALCKYNFAHVRQTVLLPWANHEERSLVRTAAAFALGIPAWEGELAPQVLALLHHWSTLPDNWRLNWTAAAAYGGLVGLRFPDQALRDLYTIAQAGDLRLFGVMSRSVINLFQAGHLASEYYFKVIDALLTWAEDSKAKLVVLTSLYIFLQIALEDKIEAGAPGTAMPTLLWLAQENDLYRYRLNALWCQSLNNKIVRESALETLRQWILLADNDAQTYSSLKAMITNIVSQGTDHEEERLRHYLNRWANNPRQKSKAADKILSALYRN
jgi:hypothetical protein